MVTCDWFALCTNEADGAVWHPVLEYVATCKRCATKHDLDLIPIIFERTSS